MVAFTVHGDVFPAIAAASAHGLTDLSKSPPALLPYLLVCLPFPSFLVTPLFLSCSIVHFGRDLGMLGSLLMHVTFASLAPFVPRIAWMLFSLFYCCVHVPLHATRALVSFKLKVTILAFGIATSLFVQRRRLVVTHTLQMGVVAHILVDEIARQNEPSLVPQSALHAITNVELVIIR